MKRAGTLLHPPAAKELIVRLRGVLPRNVPDDYFAFLERHNGGDIWPNESAWSGLGFDYLRLDSAEEVIVSQLTGCFSDHRDLLVIGTDGGGQLLCYDLRCVGNWHIVMYCPGAPDHLNYLPVADSLTQLERRYAGKA